MQNQPDIDPRVRFYERVDRTGDCWVWTGGARNAGGYGRVTYQKKDALAHRVAWMLEHGAIPDGLEVCHHCDNPPCVRIDHLFLGTHKGNGMDMGRKGRAGPTRHPDRYPRGEAWHRIYTFSPFCKNGHLLVYDPKIRRNRCRTCKNQQNRRWMRECYRRKSA